MRRGLRCLGVLGLVVVAAGCWPASGQGPGRQAYNPFESAITPDTVAGLGVKWSATTDAGGVGDPIVSNAGVHVTASEALYGFNRSTGTRLWVKPNPNPGLPFDMGQPIADGSRLLVGSGFGNLGGHWSTEWVDAATGATLATPAGGLVDGLRGSTVLLDSYGFGSNTPIAIGIGIVDLDDPSAGWSGTIDVLSPGQGTAPPMTLGTTRAYQGGQGVMQAGGTPTRANGVRAYPVATPADACPAPATFIKCPMWSTSTDGSSATSPVLAPDETTVYVGTNAGTVYALDAATGAVQWTASVGAPVTDSPALANGMLYVPTSDGDLVVLAAGGCGAATCAPLWQGATGSSSISVQPAVAGGVVFTGSSDGGLHAFAAAGCGAATCPSLWSASTGSAISGAPAVSGGRLYVATTDGHLVAYGLP